MPLFEQSVAEISTNCSIESEANLVYHMQIKVAEERMINQFGEAVFGR